MKRGLLFFVIGMAALANIAPVAAAERKQPPRGSGYSVLVKTYRNGKPAYRVTYPGYSANFPPPAFLYYGYPHSYHSYGMGPTDIRQ